MLNIPTSLIQNLNTTDGSDPWLVLIELHIEDESEALRIVNNNEDITWSGNEYVAYPFTMSLPQQSNKGDLPSVMLSISNVTRALQPYVEEYNGCVGSMVRIIVVNAGLLEEDYSELTTELTIMSCTSSASDITFQLGAANPLQKKFPPDQYIASHCRFKFKGALCGYTGIGDVCVKTLDQCKVYGNSARFGGHPGLSGDGIRVV